LGSYRIAKRPDRKALDSQIKRGFPYVSKEGSLLRRNKAEAIGIPDKQLANSSLDCGQDLQKAMGNRIFFKWIKGNLEIKHYYGKSANAVKTQIWIAVSSI
jgi:hypothetical protein